MIKEAIGMLVKRQDLSSEDAARVMEEIMEGQTTPAQLGAFLSALSAKGETGDEIAGMAGVMRARAIQVKVDGPALDIVGTGGDGLNTFNISTAAALVAAGAGIKVAKHGNRAASGRCGSADVLEKLGVRIDLTVTQVEKCIEETGIGFLFAPAFHPAMKYAAGTRREIGIRTVFNILGPLTNPAYPRYQVIGVPDEALADKMLRAIYKLGVKHGLVVHGLNGMDEISITGRSAYWEVKSGLPYIVTKYISPEDCGLTISALKNVEGGTPEENAATIRRILGGERGAGRDIVVMNAAAALMAAEKAETIPKGAGLAQAVIDDGRALAKLNALVEFTRKAGP
jgi:anthranilate phosphoribosyltransferase